MLEKQLGFSLLELLVVIAILAILTGIGIPTYQSFRQKAEMQHVSYLLPDILRVARNEAFLHFQDVIFCSSSDTSSCSMQNKWENHLIIFIDTNNNKTRDSAEKIILKETLQLKYGDIIWKGARNDNYLMFRQVDGLPQGSQGSFYYCSKSKELSRRIVLNAMGHSRVVAKI